MIISIFIINRNGYFFFLMASDHFAVADQLNKSLSMNFNLGGGHLFICNLQWSLPLCIFNSTTEETFIFLQMLQINTSLKN